MKYILMFVVFVPVLVLLLKSTTAYPQAGLKVGSSRARRQANCPANQYRNGNLCCLNCKAGTYVKSPCTVDGERGQCEECDYDTYIKHDNELRFCLKCTRCRPDEEIVSSCTHTEDTKCQCKPGRFCDPNQACEVCLKCSRCAEDEEKVRNCTSTTNTECKKIQNKSGSDPGIAVVVVVVVLCVLAAITFAGIFFYKKKCKTGSQRNLSDRSKAEQQYTAIQTPEDKDTRRPTSTNLILSQHLVRVKSANIAEDERQILNPSLNSSASNSQHSLTDALTPAPQASPVVPEQLHRREEVPLPELVPVNGEESLRKCFEYFEELDVNYHKRFFRQLEISDNVIKSKENLPYEDRIHELLHIWVEKEGKGASLNDLLQALNTLNQRRTAETIHQKAVDSGHFLSLWVGDCVIVSN
ncbi:tumor necrosis factor receptor superfamily member 10B isoform X1 [Oreochromis niloticus]|uniref:Hematopoietic death receptor n=1 Tax=Oreochromis niloticus TaxID=8128 RepID=A0A669E9G7_ORENI|nr:tumor necrosis factor receptor superfamily member 10B isoform X1 [Oreochromis niloticus]